MTATADGELRQHRVRDLRSGWISLSCQPGPDEDHARCTQGPERAIRVEDVAPRCVCNHHVQANWQAKRNNRMEDVSRYGLCWCGAPRTIEATPPLAHNGETVTMRMVCYNGHGSD